MVKFIFNQFEYENENNNNWFYDKTSYLHCIYSAIRLDRIEIINILLKHFDLKDVMFNQMVLNELCNNFNHERWMISCMILGQLKTIMEDTYKF